MKVVIRKPPDGSRLRYRGAQAAALFFFGFATAALLLVHVILWAIFMVVAAIAAAWDMGWRVFVQHEPPE
jgi:hypothetical protein